MNETVIPRNALAKGKELLAFSPIVVVTGARQVGKTTFTRLLTSGSEQVRFVNLDEKSIRDGANDDPDGFADQFLEGTLVIDEIQRVPDLMLSIKAALEKDRRPGRFVITGSSNLHSLRGSEESLAGRAQSIHMEGFSRGERLGRFDDFAAAIWGGKELNVDGSSFSRNDNLQIVLSTDFPELMNSPSTIVEDWLDNYVDRVMSKDLFDLGSVRFPDRLRPLLEILSASNGAETSFTNLARAVEIPERSLPTYLRALEDVYLVRRMPAWQNTLLKRPVSKPKFYLRDTAMAANILGIEREALDDVFLSTNVGGLLEGFVVGELAKQKTWSKIKYRMYHFRDSTGPEVDIILENRQRQVVGIEVKATTSVGSKHFSGLRHLERKLGDKFKAGIVIHLGEHSVPFGEKLWALPLCSLWSL